LVALEQHVGRVRPQVNALRNEAVDVLQQRALVLGHMDRRAGALRQVGDAAEMIPVPVRDQDRRTARPESGELEAQARCLGAGIDDDRLGRAALGANDVTVRPGASEWICIDDEAHWAFESKASLAAPTTEDVPARTGTS